MEKIVFGVHLVGEFRDDLYDVRTWSCNGVTERSARRVIEWREVGPFPGLELPFLPVKGSALPVGELGCPAWLATLQIELEAEREAAEVIDAAERKAKALQSSARRAKTKCRRFIISENFDEMLTLTYRENQPDRELCKKHFKEWVRRMKRSLGEFRYCASFEVQERGSMHVHCATNKLPTHVDYKRVKIKAWQLGTKIWRSIVGEDNGLCYVGAAPSKWGSKRRKNMSLAKMAGYVSKYILKDFETAPEEKNRYSRSVSAP